MNIKIVYIATANYIKMFQPFFNSLKKWATEDTKIVHLLTNEDINVAEYNDTDNIAVKTFHIQHYPWPIITLFKMHHVYNHIEDNDDMVFYFNANTLLKSCQTLPKEWERDKMLFFRSNKKGNEAHWAELNPYNCVLRYILGGFWGGKAEEVKKCCEVCISHIGELLEKNIIEKKHDESALNYYFSTIANQSNWKIFDYNDFFELDKKVWDNGNLEQKKREIYKGVLE